MRATERVRAADGAAQSQTEPGMASPPDTDATRGFGDLLRERVASYRTVVAWFARDAYGRFRGRVLLIVALGLLSMGGLVGALGVVFFYIDALEDGATLAYGPIALTPRESPALLAAAAAVALSLFAGSFIFRYMANLQALAIGRLYEEHCARRAIALIGTYGGRPEARAWADKAANLFQGDSRYCGRVARITVNMILPVIAFVTTFTVLMVLDPLLTLIIIVLLAAALPFLYVVNVRGARHSKAMERHAKGAGARKRELLTASAETGEPLDAESPRMRNAFAKGPIARHLDAYVGRLRASRNSELVTNIVMGIGIAVILGTKGSQILASGQGWSELAVYMIALRFNLTSVTQASKTLTSVNRFYPQVARYFRFVRDMENLPAQAPAGTGPTMMPDMASPDDDDE